MGIYPVKLLHYIIFMRLRNNFDKEHKILNNNVTIKALLETAFKFAWSHFNFILCQNYMVFLLILNHTPLPPPPPSYLRQGLALFVVAQGWLFPDIEWFVLFFYANIYNGFHIDIWYWLWRSKADPVQNSEFKFRSNYM